MQRSSVTGRGRASSARTCASACSRAATRSSSSTTSTTSTTRRSSARTPQLLARRDDRRGRHPRRGAVARALRRGHASTRSCTWPRWPACGRRSRDPLHYADVNVRGTLVLLEELSAARRRASSSPRPRASTAPTRSVPFREDDDIHQPGLALRRDQARRRAPVLHAPPPLRHPDVAACASSPSTARASARRWRSTSSSRACSAGKPIPFFGDGTTRRDYTYVDDIVDGVVRALDRCRGLRDLQPGRVARRRRSPSSSRLIGEALRRRAGPRPPADAARRRARHLRRRRQGARAARLRPERAGAPRACARFVRVVPRASGAAAR